MKKPHPKKLVLNREILRVLDEVEVNRVRGGAVSSGEVNCPLPVAVTVVTAAPIG